MLTSALLMTVIDFDVESDKIAMTKSSGVRMAYGIDKVAATLDNYVFTSLIVSWPRDSSPYRHKSFLTFIVHIYLTSVEYI